MNPDGSLDGTKDDSSNSCEYVGRRVTVAADVAGNSSQQLDTSFLIIIIMTVHYYSKNIYIS